MGASTVLAIIGNTHHAYDSRGRLCTHAALSRQIDQWASHFDSVRFAGCLLPGPPPPSFLPYESDNITLVPLRLAGGAGWRAKLGVVLWSMSWLQPLIALMRSSDAVHLRAPCNVTLLAIPLARLFGARRYAIYAGSWWAYDGEPPTYRAQRWMLRRLYRAPVHVYGDDRSSKLLVRSFSPSYTRREVEEERGAIDSRCEALHRAGGFASPLRTIYLANLTPNKRHDVAVEAVALLRDRGTDIDLTVAGEGPTRGSLERLIRDLDLSDRVHLEGSLHVADVRNELRQADVALFGAVSEGYPKAMLEAMSHGVIPVATSFASSIDMLDTGRRGVSFVFGSGESLAEAIELLIHEDPASLVARVRACHEYAADHTIEVYATLVAAIVEGWGLSSPPKRETKRANTASG